MDRFSLWLWVTITVLRAAEFQKARSDNYKLVCHEGNSTQIIELALKADTKAQPNGRRSNLRAARFRIFSMPPASFLRMV